MFGVCFHSRVTELTKVSIRRQQNASWRFVEAEALTASPTTENLDTRLTKNVSFSETKPGISGTEVDSDRNGAFLIRHVGCVEALCLKVARNVCKILG